MIGRMARAVAALALVLAGTNAILGPRPARADSVADFYKGRTVEVYVGYSTGGGYDIYARMLVRHMGRFIPGNPTLVAKNMEGAGSLRLANWLANAAPRDGTAFGTIGRGTAFDPLLGNKNAQFDAAKVDSAKEAAASSFKAIAAHQAEADAAKAALDQALLNLSYTKIYAPANGIVGKRIGECRAQDIGAFGFAQRRELAPALAVELLDLLARLAPAPRRP